MEAVQKTYWYLLVLAISLLLLKESEQAKASSTTVLLRDGMVLDCLCPWMGRLIMVSWTKRPKTQPLAVFHPEFGANFAEMYEGRVEFIKASPMDGSIRVKNVSDEDVGVYSCSMQTFPQGSWTKETLVQRHAVSTVISIHPDRELVVSENDRLVLSCPYMKNDTVNEVIMEKLKDEEGGGVGRVVLAVCLAGQNVGELQESADRGGVNCTDATNPSLHFERVSPEDGGLYRCNFSTSMGSSHTTTVQLRILPTQGPPLWGQLYLFVGGGALVLVLVLVIVGLWLRRLNRRRRRRWEYRIQQNPAKRRNIYKREQGGMYDKMAKNPIYANLHHPVRVHGRNKR